MNFAISLSKNFTWEEAIFSATAKRLGIDNTPNAEMQTEIMKTALFMERVRGALGDRPIHPTSWYRCEEVDRIVGGQSGHHSKGAAVDFICPTFGNAWVIANFLAKKMTSLHIGQLILEYDAWVHISRLPVSPINRILTYKEPGKPLVGIIR